MGAETILRKGSFLSMFLVFLLFSTYYLYQKVWKIVIFLKIKIFIIPVSEVYGAFYKEA